MLDTSMGMLGVSSIVLPLLVVIFVLILWFFLSRASVRANEQVRLLREITEQQKRQIELLTALLNNATGSQQDNSDTVSPLDFKGVIPER